MTLLAGPRPGQWNGEEAAGEDLFQVKDKQASLTDWPWDEEEVSRVFPMRFSARFKLCPRSRAVHQKPVK